MKHALRHSPPARRDMLAAALLVAGCLGSAPGGAAAITPATSQEFFTRHCLGCHSGAEPEGGLDLERLTAALDHRHDHLQDDPLDGAEVRGRWTAIHDRIAAGEMPPADEPRPPAADTAAVLADLAVRLVAADTAAAAREGRAVSRRLTAAEFENALRDLLDIPQLEIRRMLPADGARHGFDKIGDVLDLSHVQIEEYLAAIDMALDLAIATRSQPPPVLRRRFDVATMLKFRQNLNSGAAVLLTGLAPDTRWYGTGRRDKTTPAADPPPGLPAAGNGVGFLTPNLGGHEKFISFIPIFPGNYRLRMSIWSFVWRDGHVEPSPRTEVALLQLGPHVLGYFDAPSLEPRTHEITTWMSGRQPPLFDVASLTWESSSGDAGRPGIAMDWFEVEGPVIDHWPPESHRRLFGDLPIEPFAGADQGRPPRRPAPGGARWTWPSPRDLPATERDQPLESVVSADPPADAALLLAKFLPRAFRRPVTDEELARHVGIAVDRLVHGDCFEDAMRQAFKAALVSPQFLFRHEPPGSLDDHAIATRLALWLWNGPPDDELLATAAAGRLRDPAILRAQLDRLLDDPRSERFTTDFLDQWLNLADIDDTDPDKKLYPEFQFNYLKDSMLGESRAFFRELIAQDLPITNLVVSDFAMLNERLVQHYRLANLPAGTVVGSRIHRVPLPAGSHRGGFLAQGAVLKVTANGTTTSPVLRGAFVSERILGEMIPPPPPNVPAVEPDTRGATTIREQLLRHQADAACAACHRKMDPPGYALESFDPIGGWRDRYRSEGAGDPVTELLFDGRQPRFRLGLPVDASGTLADGRDFAGFEGFRRLLASDPARLARAFTAQMVMYATGAEPSFADRAEIDRIVQATAADGHGIRSLMHAIAASRLFLEK
jgi:hypothetical protein